jgi:LCP family protein required for cell wall assembly
MTPSHRREKALPELNTPRSKPGRSAAQRPSSTQSYSRYSQESSSYAHKRRTRSTKKKVFIGVLIGVLALLVAAATVLIIFVNTMNKALQGDIDLEVLGSATVDRGKPQDPFWMLLVGTDYLEEGEYARSDSMILVRIDPGHKTAALVSIPRDTRVQLPGYGTEKINAAYSYGCMEEENGHSGPEFAINAVSDLCGVGIAGYAQVDINGFVALVDAIGGVDVDVLFDISDDEAGDVDVHAGLQRLDGQHAIVFVRSRDYDIGDYQRQANQRVFLEALATQMLEKDPLTIANSIAKVCEMTSTNFDIATLGQIATSMQGMEEYDMHSYSLPCTSQIINEIWYEIPDVATIRRLIAMIDAGQFPDPDEMGLKFQGEVPDAYKPSGTSATDMSGAQATDLNVSDYVVAVRNGYGISGSATAVSTMLAQAGYEQGEIGDVNSYIYADTLIIYRSDKDRAAAEDIRMRLGYGRIIPSQGRYGFEGDILVVVGGDFK